MYLDIYKKEILTIGPSVLHILITEMIYFLRCDNTLVMES